MVEQQELSPKAVRMLVGMRELLARGWCQGASAMRGTEAVVAFDPDADHYCLEGARLRVGREMEVSLLTSDEVAEALHAAVGRNTQDWNDAPYRTLEDVLRLIDGILAKVGK